MCSIRRVIGNHSAGLVANAVTLAILLALTLGAETTSAAIDRTPPTKPTNFRVTQKTAYSVSLAWGPSTDNSGSFVYFLADTANPSQRVTLPKTATSFTFNTGLYQGNSYTFIIQAADAAGNYSSPISVNTTLPGDTTPPTTAPVVAVTEVGSHYVSLEWTASHDDGPFLFYEVFLNGSTSADAGTNQTATLTSLQPGTTYTFTVQAHDYGGNLSPISSPVIVTTELTHTDTTPPITPGNLTDNGMSFDDGETWLFWDQSTDDQTPQSFIRYDVYLNGAFDGSVVGSGGPYILYAEVGAPNTFQVIAVDEEDNQASPATLTIDLR